MKIIAVKGFPLPTEKIPCYAAGFHWLVGQITDPTGELVEKSQKKEETLPLST